MKCDIIDVQLIWNNNWNIPLKELQSVTSNKIITIDNAICTKHIKILFNLSIDPTGLIKDEVATDKISKHR